MDLKIEAGLRFRNFHLGLFLISSMSLRSFGGLQTKCYNYVADRF